MDKQEYREFLEEIKYEYEGENYKKVITYAEELDPRRIKESRILEMVSDSYLRLGYIEEARDVLALAYDKNNPKKQIIYRLCELSIEIDDLDKAVEYYEDYSHAARGDSKRYILKYEIGKAGGVSVNDLIKVLESYNNVEKDERWQYELASLYHEAGESGKCVSLCDEIFLWYGDGEYVKKALELKNRHTSLSPAQQRQYEYMMREYMDSREMSPEIPLYNAEDDIIAEEFAAEFLEEKAPKIEEAMKKKDLALREDEDWKEPAEIWEDEPVKTRYKEETR